MQHRTWEAHPSPDVAGAGTAFAAKASIQHRIRSTPICCHPHPQVETGDDVDSTPRAISIWLRRGHECVPLRIGGVALGGSRDD
jgi:hypothetical protein